jgi:hypothetical protein
MSKVYVVLRSGIQTVFLILLNRSAYSNTSLHEKCLKHLKIYISSLSAKFTSETFILALLTHVFHAYRSLPESNRSLCLQIVGILCERFSEAILKYVFPLDIETALSGKLKPFQPCRTAHQLITDTSKFLKWIDENIEVIVSVCEAHLFRKNLELEALETSVRSQLHDTIMSETEAVDKHVSEMENSPSSNFDLLKGLQHDLSFKLSLLERNRQISEYQEAIFEGEKIKKDWKVISESVEEELLISRNREVVYWQLDYFEDASRQRLKLIKSRDFFETYSISKDQLMRNSISESFVDEGKKESEAASMTSRPLKKDSFQNVFEAHRSFKKDSVEDLDVANAELSQFEAFSKSGESCSGSQSAPNDFDEKSITLSEVQHLVRSTSGSSVQIIPSSFIIPVASETLNASLESARFDLEALDETVGKEPVEDQVDVEVEEDDDIEIPDSTLDHSSVDNESILSILQPGDNLIKMNPVHSCSKMMGLDPRGIR